MAKKDTRETLPLLTLDAILSEKTLGADRMLQGHLLKKNLPLSSTLGVQRLFPYAIGGILYAPGRGGLFHYNSPDRFRVAPYGIQGETLITEGGEYGFPCFKKSVLLAFDDLIAAAATLRQKFIDKPTVIRIEAHPKIAAILSQMLYTELNGPGELLLPSQSLISRITSLETNQEFVKMRSDLLKAMQGDGKHIDLSAIRQDAIRFLQERQNPDQQRYYSFAAARLNGQR